MFNCINATLFAIYYLVGLLYIDMEMNSIYFFVWLKFKLVLAATWCDYGSLTD